MRAVVVTEYGDEPHLAHVPIPQAHDDGLLIRIHAAGVNPMDIAIAAGAFKPAEPQFPMILGADFAGVVEAAGAHATRFRTGDRVFGQLLIAPIGSTGTYAEYVACPEDAPLTLVPSGIDMLTAASLPTPGMTAVSLIDAVGPLSRRSVLIVGAAGGVGSLITQLAANAGARVTAVASAIDADRLKTYGAEEVIDHTTASVTDEISRHDPSGVDVLIDLANDRAEFERFVELLHTEGVAVSTRYAADPDATRTQRQRVLNFALNPTVDRLDAIGSAVATGRVIVPPLQAITLADAAGEVRRGAAVKTVIDVSRS